MKHTATYSPEDNKLRLYPAHRLDADDYARVRAAGFAWAPKQELFVAPAWTPEREDLLLAMCPDGIGDEDTSLVERAEERAERFEDYSAKREQDAERAHAAVSAIADNIPLGQPILVGHHSERHARRDAEKIENGMRRAVNAWKTAKYWEQRAAGALAHAKYKELPAVRARRIKGLEADRRKQERSKVEAQHCLSLWNLCTNLRQARLIAGTTEAGWLPTAKHPTLDQYLHPSDVLPFEDRDEYKREHYPTWTLEQVQERAREVYAGSIARADRWTEHLDNRLAYERAMLADAGGTVADRTKPEKGGAVRCWCSPRGGWSKIQKVNKVSVTVLDNWGNGGRDFTRTVPFDKLKGVMSAAQVDQARADDLLIAEDARGFGLAGDPGQIGRATQPRPEPTKFDQMADSLKAGVQVVSAPNLFPTPVDVAGRVAAYADLRAGDRVLEPSAGTGRLLDAIEAGPHGEVVAVEVSYALAEDLRRRYPSVEVRCADFLSTSGDIGTFDRVVMNPPFDHGEDIRHVRHALEHLRPGGRLVAIVANGPKQREAFYDDAEHWEDLESGTFAGTSVRAALVVLVK